MCDINVHTDSTVPGGKSHEVKVNKDIEVGNQENNTLWKRQSIIKIESQSVSPFSLHVEIIFVW